MKSKWQKQLLVLMLTVIHRVDLPSINSGKPLTASQDGFHSLSGEALGLGSSQCSVVFDGLSISLL
jgi:hypothetical protein